MRLYLVLPGVSTGATPAQGFSKVGVAGICHSERGEEMGGAVGNPQLVGVAFGCRVGNTRTSSGIRQPARPAGDLTTWPICIIIMILATRPAAGPALSPALGSLAPGQRGRRA